jgi:hypothetical protein
VVWYNGTDITGKNLLPPSHPSVKAIFTVMNLYVPQKAGTLDRLNDSTQASNNFYGHHF